MKQKTNHEGMKTEWLKFLSTGDFFYLRKKRYVIDNGSESVWAEKIRCVTSSGKYVKIKGMQKVETFI